MNGQLVGLLQNMVKFQVQDSVKGYSLMANSLCIQVIIVYYVYPKIIFSKNIIKLSQVLALMSGGAGGRDPQDGI